MAKARQQAKGSKTWKLNYHVATVATLTPEQAVILQGLDENCELDWGYDLTPKKLNIVIDYPMDKPVGFILFPNDYVINFPRLGLILLAIAREYERIYQDPKRYGIWGHGIGDLYFERITIAPNGDVELFIGS